MRETSGWSTVKGPFEDMRFGLRMLHKTPVWTAVIAATLALGVGLSTAIFSVVYGVLLQPLPYPDPSRIVAVWCSFPRNGYLRFNVSAAVWLHWREQARLFEDIALTRPIANFNLTGDGPPERLQGARISANLFAALGMRPLLGRPITEEERLRDAKVALLSYAFWQRRFGGDPAILGRKIQLNGEPYEVVGVMPVEWRYPSAEFEIWTPLYIPKGEVLEGVNNQYVSVARLKSGVSVKQAQAEMTAIMRRLAEQYPAAYGTRDDFVDALVEPLAASDAAQVRTTLYVLLAAVGSLLLIGCMNLGVLLIARANARARELAIRAALGAGAARLRRQIWAEVLPLGIVGALGGVLLAWELLDVLRPFLPAATPRLDTIGLHTPVMVFAVGISLAVVLLASLWPAFSNANRDPAVVLKQNSGTVAGGGRARNTLVIAQIAVTLVLLFSGALFARSLQALLRVNPGFATQGTLTMHMAVARAKYRTDPQVSDYYERLLARIRSIPGVTEAGIVNRLPLSGIAQTGSVEFEGISGLFDSDWRSATPGYFEAMRIPLKEGRLFTNRDRPDSPAVGLIDERMARQVFGGRDPLGRRFRISAGPLHGPWTEIAGVVGHIRNDSPEKDIRAQVYWPETQRTQDRAALVVRTASHPDSFAPAVLEQIHKEDPDQPVYDVRAMDEWWRRALQSRNLLTLLVGLFGGASVLLACLGLYGVVSYSAGLRVREFGIRMALGGDGGHVRNLVLRHAAKLAAAGLALGLALAWPVSRAIQTLLFGIAATDTASWLVAPALLACVTILAAYAPARRAARSDPAAALRSD
ncbi:MAG: hypothetical protein C5B51_02165 [Terriglobia bacterium]|nr:MAG: hypothetical protein C5B51_02165 [Terriglobia bacterium]